MMFASGFDDLQMVPARIEERADPTRRAVGSPRRRSGTPSTDCAGRDHRACAEYVERQLGDDLVVLRSSTASRSRRPARLMAAQELRRVRIRCSASPDLAVTPRQPQADVGIVDHT